MPISPVRQNFVQHPGHCHCSFLTRDFSQHATHSPLQTYDSMISLLIASNSASALPVLFQLRSSYSIISLSTRKVKSFSSTYVLGFVVPVSYSFEQKMKLLTSSSDIRSFIIGTQHSSTFLQSRTKYPKRPTQSGKFPHFLEQSHKLWNSSIIFTVR